MRGFKMFNSLVRSIKNIEAIEVMPRSESVEVVGRWFDKPVMYTISIKTIPEWLLDPNDRGYEKPVKVKERHKRGETKVVMGTKYCLTKSEENFIKQCYCTYHLDARQISKVSGIPQPTIYTYIRHERIKPVYDDETPKPSRNNKYTNLKDFEDGEFKPVVSKKHDEKEYYKKSMYKMKPQHDYEKLSEKEEETNG